MTTTIDPTVAGPPGGPSVKRGFAATLLDKSGQPNLVTGSGGSNSLDWTLKNNMMGADDSLVITPFRDGGAGPERYNFMFTFAPGALTALPQVERWTVAAETDEAGAVTTLYLALAGTTPLVVPPEGTDAARLTYTTAVQQDTGNAVVDVTLTAGANVTLGGDPIDGVEFGPFDLTLVPAGTAPLSVPPVSVDFVGRRTVLNDGQTANTFTFAITNLTTLPLALTPASVFTAWFDAAPNDPDQPYPWALAQVQDLASEAVALAAPAGWTASRRITRQQQVVPGNPSWVVAPQGTATLEPQSPLLFTFSGIVTGLEPGVTRMYLRFQGLPGYADGILMAELEKTPLMYGAARGQGLFVAAGTYAGSTPPAAPDYGSGLSVRQYGPGPAATLSGGAGLVIRDTQGPAAQIAGSVGIAVGEGELAALAVTAANVEPALSVAQSGTGYSAVLSGGKGLRIEAPGHAAQIGGGVGIDVGEKPLTALAITAASAQPALSVSQSGGALALQVNGAISVNTRGDQRDYTAASFSSTAGYSTLYAANSGDSNAASFTNESSNYPVLYAWNTRGSNGRFSNGIVGGVVDSTDWGFTTNGRIQARGGTSVFTHLETRSGHRVATSPLTLEIEVHLSGTGTLAGGRATVAFDPQVQDVIAHAEGFRVQLTPTEQCPGLCVTAKRGDGFDVEEAGGGDGSAGFDWFVVARKRTALDEPAAHPMPDALPDMPEPPVFDAQPARPDPDEPPAAG